MWHLVGLVSGDPIPPLGNQNSCGREQNLLCSVDIVFQVRLRRRAISAYMLYFVSLWQYICSLNVHACFGVLYAYAPSCVHVSVCVCVYVYMCVYLSVCVCVCEREREREREIEKEKENQKIDGLFLGLLEVVLFFLQPHWPHCSSANCRGSNWSKGIRILIFQVIETSLPPRKMHQLNFPIPYFPAPGQVKSIKYSSSTAFLSRWDENPRKMKMRV